MAHIGEKIGLGPACRLGCGLGLEQGLLGGDTVGHIPGDAIDPVAEPLRPPFKGPVAAVPMPIAVDESQHRIPGLPLLHLFDATPGVWKIVGMDQPKKRSPLHLCGIMTQGRQPGTAGLQHPAIDIPNDQQIVGHIEKGGCVEGRRLRSRPTGLRLWIEE